MNLYNYYTKKKNNTKKLQKIYINNHQNLCQLAKSSSSESSAAFF